MAINHLLIMLNFMKINTDFIENQFTKENII